MKSSSVYFEPLRRSLANCPLIDTHDHSYRCEPAYGDPIVAIAANYYGQDLLTVLSERDCSFVMNPAVPLERRWPVFEKGWKKSCHTGYAQCVRRALREFYGIESLSLEVLQRMQGRLLELETPAVFKSILEKTGIVVRLEDLGHIPDSERITERVLDGTFTLSPRGRLIISLPRFHKLCGYEDIRAAVAPLGMTVTCLDEYLAGCRRIFEGYKCFGAVGFKDQSAYWRTLDYGLPDRAAAERVFCAMLEDPRRSLAYPDAVKPLGDYLFHQFMRCAAELELPVQLHTGHMGGAWNDITKANAVLLRRVFELHRQVRFDLLHANWPYSGELLFLAKNYPNVHINLVWAHIIDPVYCIELLKQIVSCVPHAKVHGFGSDFCGMPELAWASAEMARDHSAIALSDLMDAGVLSAHQAEQIARGWLFDNPNAFYRLGF